MDGAFVLWLCNTVAVSNKLCTSSCSPCFWPLKKAQCVRDQSLTLSGLPCVIVLDFHFLVLHI